MRKKDKDFIHKCAACKKTFSTYSAGAGWMYQNKSNKRKYYCSYACYLTYRKPLEEKYRKAAQTYE